MIDTNAADEADEGDGRGMAVVVAGMALATTGTAFSGELSTPALYGVLGLGVVLMLVGVGRLSG